MNTVDLSQALQTTLLAAVPLYQWQIADWPWERIRSAAQEAGEMIASHGDDLLYGGKQCAATFNALAQGLAILSRCPGGVTAFGQHWEWRDERESS